MRPTSLAAVVLIAWSCGGRSVTPRDADPPESGDAQGGVALAASAFCGRLRDQETTWRARCLGGTTQDWRGVLDLETTCEQVGALVAGGTVRYRADLAEACLLENAAERDCARYATLCINHVLAGARAEGAPCKSDLECPHNAGCWAPGEFGQNTCKPSTCVRLPDQEGDACMQEPFPYCFTGLSCINGACTPRRAEGETCVDLVGCAIGLRCDAGVCRKRSDRGPCVRDEDCVATQYCSPETQVCVQRSGVGGSCSGPMTNCAAFTACGANGACVPAGHLGQPCAQIEGHVICLEGRCGAGWTCEPKLANGRDCFSGSACASGGCGDLFCKDCGG